MCKNEKPSLVFLDLRYKIGFLWLGLAAVADMFFFFLKRKGGKIGKRDWEKGAWITYCY